MAPTSTFCCFLNSQKLANGDRENYWVLTNARLSFWGPSPMFTGTKNLNFRQNFRQYSELAAYYSKTRRNMENLKQQGSSMTVWLYPPQIWWGSAEHSRRNVCAIGVGQVIFSRPAMLLAAYGTRTGESRWALPRISSWLCSNQSSMVDKFCSNSLCTGSMRTTDKTLNHARSEYKHSLIFRVRTVLS